MPSELDNLLWENFSLKFMLDSRKLHPELFEPRMNPWASLLAQFASQAVTTEGPVLLEDLQTALNDSLAQHGHTVAITPVTIDRGAAPEAPAS